MNASSRYTNILKLNSTLKSNLKASHNNKDNNNNNNIID